MIHNPILKGFHPDPSIVRVGEDYYMVTSSFAYYPGLPIHHSKDLIHWEQIGHGIHRPDQLEYKNCEASLGLWAPTIRYHEGKFYIINTLVSEGREARRDNYIITADRPEGPPPMTAIFLPVSSIFCGTGTSPQLSTAKRLRPLMFTGASTRVRRHRASQGCSQI